MGAPERWEDFQARFDALVQQVLPDIQVTSIEINDALSEETLCFSADFSYKGKNYGRVGNRGHGGPHEYQGPGAYELAREISDRFGELELLDAAITQKVIDVDHERQIKRFVAAEKRRLKKYPLVAGVFILELPDGVLRSLPYEAGEEQATVLGRAKEPTDGAKVSQHPFARRKS